MIALMFIIIMFALLFVMGFVTRRRFGVLGLALAAGSLLSANWSGTLTPFIEQQGFVLIAPPLAVVVQVALVLLPPLILLFSGPTYLGLWPRVFGALGFAVLAFVFIAEPLGSVLQLDPSGTTLFNWIDKYASIIIVCGMI